MDDARIAKIKYIERTLDFHFEGAFREVVVGHDLIDEIDNWCQIAKIFDASLLDPDQFSTTEKREVFDLVEVIWAQLIAAQFVGEPPDFTDIGAGYDIHLRKYREIVERAKKVILSREH